MASSAAWPKSATTARLRLRLPSYIRTAGCRPASTNRATVSRPVRQSCFTMASGCWEEGGSTESALPWGRDELSFGVESNLAGAWPMLHNTLLLLAQLRPEKPSTPATSALFIVIIGLAVLVCFFLFICVIAFAAYGKLWFQAYMSSADVSMMSLI